MRRKSWRFIINISSNLPRIIPSYRIILSLYYLHCIISYLYNIKRKNSRIESNHSFTLNRHWETTLPSNNNSSSFFSLTQLFYAKNKRSCWKQSRCNSRNDRLHRIRGTQVASDASRRGQNGRSGEGGSEMDPPPSPPRVEKIREQPAYKGMPVEGRESARQGGRLSSWLQSKCTRLNCRRGTPLHVTPEGRQRRKKETRLWSTASAAMGHVYALIIRRANYIADN